MDFTLTGTQLELQARARAFVKDVLQPREAEFERSHGRVPRDWGNPIRAAAIAAGLHGGSFPRELGGQGWTVLEQVLVHEQLGQSTGGLWSYIPGAYNVLIHADATQRRRYLDPSLRGERSGSYAITEDAAGSDARNLKATAVRDAATGDYVLNGEKWFVTGPDDTDFMIFHCLVVEADTRLPTLFLVDYDTPGVVMRHDPDYTHTFADRHPQFVLTDVRVASLCDPRRDRAGRRADQRVVRGGADPHRCPMCRGDGAPARPCGRLGHGTRPVRRADLRFPGRQLPARRLRRRCGSRPSPDAPMRLARR